MGFEWENHVVKFTGTPFRSPDRADGSLLLEVLTRLRGPGETSIGSLAPRAVPAPPRRLPRFAAAGAPPPAPELLTRPADLAVPVSLTAAVEIH